MDETIYTIESGGIFRWTKQGVMNAEEQICSTISQEVSRCVQNAFCVEVDGDGDDHMVHVIARNGNRITMVTEMQWLHIESRFRTLTDGLTLLEFSNEGPTLKLKWAAPFPLYFAVTAMWNRGYGWQKDKVFLWTTNDQGVTYRLPLSNVYADGSFCLGDLVEPLHRTAQSLMKACLLQLQNAAYNADLRLTDMRATDALFSWRPDGTGFVQQPADVNFWSLMTPIANDSITEISRIIGIC